jgi:hypothetical protein
MQPAHVSVHHKAHINGRALAGLEHHRTDGGYGWSTTFDDFNVRCLCESQCFVTHVGQVE